MLSYFILSVNDLKISELNHWIKGFVDS